MSDAKTSELTPLAGADVADDDLFPIVDTSAGTAGSKSITAEQARIALVTAEALAALGVGITSPLDIPDCALWLDASDATTINAGSPANDDPVTTWADKSGNDRDWVGGTNDIQTIDITGASSGQYELNSAGDTTDPIAWNASAATVQTRLEALSDVGAGNVRVTLPTAQIYRVEFIGALARTSVDDLTATQDTLDVVPTMSRPTHGIDGRPTYKTAVLNGLACVRFEEDATPQNMVMSIAGLDLFRDIEGMTIAAVCVNRGSGEYILNASNGVGDTERRVQFAFDTTLFNFSATTAESGEAAIFHKVCYGIGAAGEPMILMGVADFLRGGINALSSQVPAATQTGAGGPAYLDTLGAMPDTDSVVIRIGADLQATSGTDLDVHKLIVYQRALNARERRNLFEYLSAEWNVL